MSINKRFIEVINYFEDGNKNAFARKCDLKPTTLSGIVGVRQSDPSSKILNCVLQAYPELNIRWLLTGWGEMLEERASDVGFQKLQTQECAECAHKDETVNNLKDLVESLKQDKEDLRDRVKSLKADKQRLLDSIDSATGENSTGKRNSA